MIDYTVIRKKVETLLANNFTTVPIAFENVTGTLDVEHVDITTLDSDAPSLEMGSDIVDVSGILIVRIYTFLGVGTDRAAALASELHDIMITQFNDSSLDIFNPVFSSVGEVEGRHLYQHNLTFFYRYFYGQEESTNC